MWRLDARWRDDGKANRCGCFREFVGGFIVVIGLFEFELAERVKARGPC